MTTLLVSGWKHGFQKVKFTQLIQKEFGYALSRAKGMTDAIVSLNAVEFLVPENEVSRILAAMEGLGAECAVAVPAVR